MANYLHGIIIIKDVGDGDVDIGAKDFSPLHFLFK